VDKRTFAFNMTVTVGIAKEVGAVFAGAETAFQSDISLTYL